MRELLEGTLNNVEDWVEQQGYRGYEPFDGLSSFLRPLTFRNLTAERLLQQLVRQSPLNLRPVLGIKPQESTKGRGYMASGYLFRYRTTGDANYLRKAIQCLDWLDHHTAPGHKNHSWGNHFDFSSRGGKLPRHEPIIVWSSLIGQTYLDAFEITADQRFLNIARSICAWILALPRDVTSSGSCLSYVAYAKSSIHNSNMLGAALLARTATFTGESSLLDVARSAMQYSCSRQQPDGSWWYGEDANKHWVDNFHTGYNLDSLRCYVHSTQDTSFLPHLTRGFQYFKDHFFETTGRPKYYHNRTFPVDIQCASQAIDTLTLFSSDDPSSLQLACAVARWTIEHMYNRNGFFYYRIYPWGTCRTPMLHWGQATMYKALAHLHSNLVNQTLQLPTPVLAFQTSQANPDCP